MEVPKWLYSSFWAIISITFLHLAFYAMDRTRPAVSVSPVALFLLKHSLAISTCHSSTCALIFRQEVNNPLDKSYVFLMFGIIQALSWGCILGRFVGTNACILLVGMLSCFLAWLLLELPLWKVCIGAYGIVLFVVLSDRNLFFWVLFITISAGNVLDIISRHPKWGKMTCTVIHIALETSLFPLSGKITEFYPILVMFISFLTSAYWAELSPIQPYTGVDRDHEGRGPIYLILLPFAVKLKLYIQKSNWEFKGKWIKIAIGMVVTIMFQYFFRLKSFDHVVAFLYVAVVWVANIALMGGGRAGSCKDLGILNFLLGNVIVGSTLNLYELRGKTWIAYGVALLLYGLKLTLESTSMVRRDWSERMITVVRPPSRTFSDPVQQ